MCKCELTFITRKPDYEQLLAKFITFLAGFACNFGFFGFESHIFVYFYTKEFRKISVNTVCIYRNFPKLLKNVLSSIPKIEKNLELK